MIFMLTPKYPNLLFILKFLLWNYIQVHNYIRERTTPKSWNEKHQVQNYRMEVWNMLLKDCTWHIMQESDSWSSEAASSRLISVAFVEWTLDFSWVSIVSSDKPVFTLPILSPNARRSWSQISSVRLIWIYRQIKRLSYKYYV